MRSLALPGMLLVLGLAGCASVSIRPITAEQAAAAHEPGSKVDGYIVYAPLVVVEVAPREVCTGKDAKGKCAMQSQCVAGEPFILPDYSRPYLITSHAGLGQAGLDMSIADGWRLDSLKDSSDNGALLGLVQKLAMRGGAEEGTADGSGCRAAGLYRVTSGREGLQLSRLLVY